MMKFKYVLPALAMSLLASAASAGLVPPAPLTIDFAERIATGDMYTVRISNNPAEFGCGVRYNASGLTSAFCKAGNGPDASQQITCFTNNPALVDAIKSISAFSFITFRWDADGNCTNIGVSTQSFYLPEFKAKK